MKVTRTETTNAYYHVSAGSKEMALSVRITDEKIDSAILTHGHGGDSWTISLPANLKLLSQMLDAILQEMELDDNL